MAPAPGTYLSPWANRFEFSPHREFAGSLWWEMVSGVWIYCTQATDARAKRGAWEEQCREREGSQQGSCELPPYELPLYELPPYQLPPESRSVTSAAKSCMSRWFSKSELSTCGRKVFAKTMDKCLTGS
ncbi:hypothetical protein BD626DRAFT_570393 [Schizophyllum amplum]|uniref:Uncharacterized protein n=1 Tax=Schizophyllum amplum TaxID=97359 RepID=A0A550CA54_9AGAR|nr:hypothetical protein BD626DRAFT_570393 [Auriculariopsis ampla]